MNDSQILRGPDEAVHDPQACRTAPLSVRGGGQNSNGTARAHDVGPVSGRVIFVKNSPGTARTGLGVWCDWGITNASNNFIKALDISHKSFYRMSKAGNIISRVY